MTTPAEARQAIYSAFVNTWGDIAPFVFENEDARRIDLGAEWARLVVRNETGDQDTICPAGNRKFRRRGRVLVQVFVPENVGTSRAEELATLARDAFEGLTLAGTSVNFAGVSVREVPTPADENVFQMLVDAPFGYDEIR